MTIKESIEALEKSKEFQDWKKDHQAFYLAHMFKMLDDTNNQGWQIGYYSADKDRMVTFVVENDNVQNTQETEVFKEPGKAINELDITAIKIQPDAAVEIINQTFQEHYKGQSPMKRFYIIQNLPISGVVYNATILTNAFKTINIKINAETGKVVDHKEVMLFDRMPSTNDDSDA